MDWSIRIAFVIMLLFSQSAAAQNEVGCNDLPFACGVITSTTSSTTLVIVGGIALTIILVAKDRKKALRTYLNENALAVRHDAHLGEGGTLHDLRLFLRVKDRDHGAFARWIRSERLIIDRLTSEGASDRDLESFVSQSAVRFPAVGS